MVLGAWFAGCVGTATVSDGERLWSDEAPSARIERDSPVAGAELRCRAASGPVPILAQWTVDGEVFEGEDGAFQGDVVPAGVTQDGERWTCALLGAFGPRDPGAPDEVSIGAPGGNVLIVLMDDVGAGQVGPGHRTPVLDALAAEGRSFSSGYAHALCSPTRAALLTGRYARRMGIGTAIDYAFDENVGLPESERTIAEVLRDAGYATGLFGKWHLVTKTDDDPLSDPLDHGFDRFEGLLANLALDLLDDGQENSYFHWDRIVDGHLSVDDRYVVSAEVDDALAWTASAPEPWFAYVALTGAHPPFHVPPASLAEPPKGSSQPALDAAMIEAVDTEIGRLLGAIDPEVLDRTHVFVAGDNGPSAESTVDDDVDEAKGTIHEIGNHVPFLVLSPAIREPGTSDVLVHVVDVLPTVLALTGVPLADREGNEPDLDGTSLWRVLEHLDAEPVRTVMYNDRFGPSGPPPYPADIRSVQDGMYKLLSRSAPPLRSLYRVGPGELHGDDLAKEVLSGEDLEAYERLEPELERWTERLSP